MAGEGLAGRGAKVEMRYFTSTRRTKVASEFRRVKLYKMSQMQKRMKSVLIKDNKLVSVHVTRLQGLVSVHRSVRRLQVLSADPAGLEPQSTCLDEKLQMLEPLLHLQGWSANTLVEGGWGCEPHLLSCPPQCPPLLLHPFPPPSLSLKALIVPGLTDPGDHVQQEPEREEPSEPIEADTDPPPPIPPTPHLT